MISSTDSTLLSKTLEVSVSANRNPFFAGPGNVFGYTILQGFFTVLAIKEIVSVTRYIVKGSTSSLHINSTILWHMVENWEDLFKMGRLILFPKRMHVFSSPYYDKRAPLTRLGWRRVAISAIIALFLFGADMALIVASVPNHAPQDAARITKLRWSNTARIPIVRKSTIIQGSFSRVVKLKSIENDVEFSRLPSVALDRTDFRRFGVPMPRYDGTLMVCSNSEQWRVLCRIHCQNRLYQYKLRLDVTTDTNSSSFFVPTNHITVSRPNGPNRLQDYIEALKTQLNITVKDYKVEGNQTKPGYFKLITETEPPENTTVASGEKLLTHDAIATLFLGSIKIEAVEKATYYVRRAGERYEYKGQVNGMIATSQRPLLPLIATIVIYVLLQAISVIQQKGFKLHSLSPEMTALFEIAGASCVENMANVDVQDRPITCSVTHGYLKDTEGVVGHRGYMPGIIAGQIREYWEEGSSDFGRERYGIVDIDYLAGVRKIH